VPYEAPSQGVGLQGLPIPIIFYPKHKAFLSVFELGTAPYSLGPITVKCEFCTALHFIKEAASPSRHYQLFESCCKKGDVYLEPLKGILPYLQTLFKSQTPNKQHFC
jgi:hypothetical protein